MSQVSQQNRASIDCSGTGLATMSWKSGEAFGRHRFSAKQLGSLWKLPKKIGIDPMCREYGDFIQPDLFVADYLYLVGGLEHEFYDFPYIRNVIIPTDDLWKRLETTNRYIRFSLIPQIPLAVWTSGTSRLSFSLDESRVRLLFSQGTSLFDHVSKAIQSPNLLWLNGCFANITIFVVLDVFLCYSWWKLLLIDKLFGVSPAYPVSDLGPLRKRKNPILFAKLCVM